MTVREPGFSPKYFFAGNVFFQSQNSLDRHYYKCYILSAMTAEVAVSLSEEAGTDSHGTMLVRKFLSLLFAYRVRAGTVTGLFKTKRF